MTCFALISKVYFLHVFLWKRIYDCKAVEIKSFTNNSYMQEHFFYKEQFNMLIFCHHI